MRKERLDYTQKAHLEDQPKPLRDLVVRVEGILLSAGIGRKELLFITKDGDDARLYCPELERLIKDKEIGGDEELEALVGFMQRYLAAEFNAIQDLRDSRGDEEGIKRASSDWSQRLEGFSDELRFLDEKFSFTEQSTRLGFSGGYTGVLARRGRTKRKRR